MKHLAPHRKGQRYSDEIREKALNMMRNGVPINQLAREMNLGERTLQTWKAEANLPKGTRYTPQVKERALALLAEGVTVTDITLRLHIARATVEFWRNETPREKNLAPAPYARGYVFPGGRGWRWG